MKILVTGGAGFIGSQIVKSFQGIAQEIRVLDNLRSGRKENLEGLDHKLFVGSITDADVVAKVVSGVDLVFHCAALANIPDCNDAPSECHRVNIEGLATVLKTSKFERVRRFFFLSSAAVYGPTPPLPTPESSSLVPDSLYGRSKAAGEGLVTASHDPHGMTTVSLRLFNVFGPRQNPETENAAVVARFILQALKNEPLVIFGDGGQTRDFIFVEDVVQTMHKLINRKDIPGPINLGSERAISLNDLASMIIVQTKSTSRIIHQNSRLGDSRDSISTNTTLLQLGWKTSFDFEVGLSKTVAWYRETLEVKNRTRSSTCPSS